MKHHFTKIRLSAILNKNFDSVQGGINLNYVNALLGLILTALVALTAQYLAGMSYLHLLGPMVTAILLGMILRAILPRKLAPYQSGFGFSAKIILRLGIILMGLRLNFNDILAAGWKTVVLDLSVIIFTLSVMIFLGRYLKMPSTLAGLIAVGSGVCGAAAIGAVAPVMKAKPQDIALSVAIIAILGTFFTMIDTALFNWLALSPHWYGLFTGSTLHELAHVIAASAVGGLDSSNTAIVVKLGRVAFIAPVALILGYFYYRRESMSYYSLPIPWFIFGFLALAGATTLELLPEPITQFLVKTSVFCIAMSMAGMGLNVTWKSFHEAGMKPILLCFTGSIALMLFSYLALMVLQL